MEKDIRDYELRLCRRCQHSEYERISHRGGRLRLRCDACVKDGGSMGDEEIPCGKFLREDARKWYLKGEHGLQALSMIHIDRRKREEPIVRKLRATEDASIKTVQI